MIICSNVLIVISKMYKKWLQLIICIFLGALFGLLRTSNSRNSEQPRRSSERRMLRGTIVNTFPSYSKRSTFVDMQVTKTMCDNVSIMFERISKAYDINSFRERWTIGHNSPSRRLFVREREYTRSRRDQLCSTGTLYGSYGFAFHLSMDGESCMVIKFV